MQYFTIKKYWYSVRTIMMTSVLPLVFLLVFVFKYGSGISSIWWIFLLLSGGTMLFALPIIYKIRSFEAICNSVVPQEAVVIDCVPHRKKGYSLVVVLDNMERHTPPFFKEHEAKPLVGKKISCAVINKEVFIYSI